MRIILAIFAVLLLIAAGFAGFIHSGVYNVAASVPHSAPARWLLNTTRENSVRARAAGIEVPPLERHDPDQGLQRFDHLCVICHGAPGVDPSEIGVGLLPEPPALPGHLDHWNDAELFWIISNGFKYTGMPAFGGTLGADELWDILAFLQELPQITPARYQDLRAGLKMENRREQPLQIPEPHEPWEGILILDRVIRPAP